jgi:hypothetical protein
MGVPYRAHAVHPIAALQVYLSCLSPLRSAADALDGFDDRS